MLKDPDLKRELDVLNRELFGVIEVWDTWKSLFRHPDAAARFQRTELMISPTLLVEPFFGQLYNVLLRDTVVGISRLFDSSGDAVRIDTLVKHTGRLPARLRPTAKTLSSQANRTFKAAKDVRNNFIAHRNRVLALTTEGEGGGGTIRFDDIDETVRLTASFLDLFNVELTGMPYEWHHFYEDTSNSLFLALDLARRWKTDVGFFPKASPHGDNAPET